MTRRLKSRNRKYAGNRTYGGGNKKNRRGKGSKGGRGRAGWHKHKWMRTVKYELESIRFNHKGFSAVNKEVQTVTLQQINKLMISGKLEKKDGAFHFSLPHVKVIGSLPLDAKANIVAAAFSKGAKQSIEKSGGTATILEPAQTPTVTKPEAKAKAAK